MMRSGHYTLRFREGPPHGQQQGSSCDHLRRQTLAQSMVA